MVTAVASVKGSSATTVTTTTTTGADEGGIKNGLPVSGDGRGVGIGQQECGVVLYILYSLSSNYYMYKVK